MDSSELISCKTPEYLLFYVSYASGTTKGGGKPNRMSLFETKDMRVLNGFTLTFCFEKVALLSSTRRRHDLPKKFSHDA